MKHGELEELFERYRGAQDLDALGRLFDLAAPELLRLAVHIAPDLAAAEDLVQQTFLAAIEKPKRWRASEPLLPWLFGILSNLAKKQRRSARRTPDAERLHSRTPEDPARAALSAETLRAAESALDRIPELYRGVVRASLFDEKPPHEIARELDRAPGTVRMQLLRGLELMRRAMPGGLAGGGALILCGTRGEAALRAVVLRQAATQTALVAGTAAAGSSTLVLGGLLVSAKTVLAVLIGVALSAWLLWPDSQPPELQGATSTRSTTGDALVSSEAQISTDAETTLRSAVDAAPESAPANATSTAAARVAGWWLVGQLVDVRTEHAADVELHISRKGVHGEVIAKADAQGHFEIDLAQLFGPRPRTSTLHGEHGAIEIAWPETALPEGPPELDIWSRHPRYISEREVVLAADVPDELAPGERREIRRDVRMRPASVVSGRVQVPPGWRVEDVEVRVDPVELNLNASSASLFSLERASCAADGSYWLKSIQSGERIIYTNYPGLVPVAVHCMLVSGEVLELPDLVLEEGSCEIEGRVDLPPAWLAENSGLGHGEMMVTAVRVDPPARARTKGAEDGVLVDAANVRSFASLRGGYPIDMQTATIDREGRFRIRAIEPGKWELAIQGIQSQSMFAPYEKTVVEAPASNLVIGSELCRMSAFVVDASGPVHDAIVTFGDGANFQSIPAGAEGRVAVVGDLRQAYTLSAHAPGRQSVTLELPVAGRKREDKFEIRLQDAPPTARLVLLAPQERAAPKTLQVHLRPLDDGERAPPDRNETVALADGRYVIANVFTGRWKIEVGPSHEQVPVAFYGAYTLTERFDVTLVAGSDCVQTLRCEAGGRARITLDGGGAPGTAVNCTLVHPDGRRTSPRIVNAESGEGFGVFMALDGIAMVGRQNALEECLLPGNYELRADARGESVPFEIKANETTQVLWKLAR